MTYGFSHWEFYFSHPLLPCISAKTYPSPELTCLPLIEAGAFLDVKEKQEKYKILLFTEVYIILLCVKTIFLINSIFTMWTIYLIWFWVTSVRMIVSSDSISFLLTTEKIYHYVNIQHFHYSIISRRISVFFFYFWLILDSASLNMWSDISIMWYIFILEYAQELLGPNIFLEKGGKKSEHQQTDTGSQIEVLQKTHLFNNGEKYVPST